MTVTQLTFARRQHGLTHWIEGEYSGDDKPSFFADLEAAGWTVIDYRGFFMIDPPRGTDLFAGWNPDEKRTYMKQARSILKKHGFVKVPVWTKTIQDML